jgi:two-component system, OmpR family, phosphate regulon sensor histidine kinase PhoR
MRKLVVFTLLLSLMGLGFIQYRFLAVGLKLAKVRFDLQTIQALQGAKLSLEDENRLSVLLVAAIRREPGSFRLSVDSLEQAATGFFADFLQDRLLRQGIKVDFEFEIAGVNTKQTYLKSAGYERQAASSAHYELVLSGYLPAQCGRALMLRLHVNNLSQYLLAQLRGLLIPCLLCFLLIGGCLWWLLRFLNQQRRLDAVKNDFINNLAHELKTPAFIIGMAAQMLEDHVPNGKPREYLKVIQAENKLLKTHVEKVLELASLKSGAHVLSRQPLDVHPLLSRLAANFQGTVEARDGTFRFLPEASPSTASADAAHLNNAVQNLLDNALKYSPGQPHITLRTYHHGSKLCIAVTDRGIGISPAFQKKIFSRHFRVLHGDQHEVKGFGLGLSYARQVALLHGGDIKVESQMGAGSTFVLELPAST